MIEFLLSLLLALLIGTSNISQVSSITSDNYAPHVTTYVEWPGYYLQWGNR